MRREKEQPRCGAPIHAKNCDGVGKSIDHFTPKCIGKLWGWTKQQINAQENLQNLSKACHKEKDKTTQARYVMAILQKKGANIPFGVHQQIEEPGYCLPKIKREKLIQHKRNKIRKKRSNKHYKNSNRLIRIK
jgi:hypothetical protein